MAGQIVCGIKPVSYSSKKKDLMALCKTSDSSCTKAITLPVRGVEFKSVSLMKSYVTSSVQLTIAFRAMLGPVPV